MAKRDLDDAREAQRADELTAEEVAAGSEALREQARAILEDSDARQADRDAAPGAVVEHRTSESTAEPTD